MNVFNRTLLMAMPVLLSSCASQQAEKYQPQPSFLEGGQVRDSAGAVIPGQRGSAQSGPAKSGFSKLAPISYNKAIQEKTQDLLTRFSDSETVTLSSDALPLKDFLHYVMGEVLQTSYILGEATKSDKRPVTLNLQQAVSKRRLFALVEELLAGYGYLIRFNEGIFYINREENSQGQADIAYGYGQSLDSVPQVSSKIIQLVPFTFGFNSGITLVLQQIANVQARADSKQGVMMLTGKRQEIIKAIEFIQLFDAPKFRSRQVALYKATYTGVDNLTVKLPELLRNDGYDGALSMVPLPQQGMLVLFANDEAVLTRAGYWLEQMDQPLEGGSKQYFVFQPKFARAMDLNESLAPLIGGSTSGLSSRIGNTRNSSAASQDTTAGESTARRSSGSRSASNKDMTIVVDERSNSLIVHTTGEKYRTLLPLMKRLDVMPKQVMLEVVIAEVTLTDEFKQGVEFALNRGSYGLSTKGAFKSTEFGGLAYNVIGSDAELFINLFETNSLVNILSRPSILVRDGVTATISVGTDIPTVGGTITNGEGFTTTNTEYRKTGVDMEVTPTINSQGVVIMEISQENSSEADVGSTVSDSPAIFERKIKTEAVANSGQTVILGGLISEDISDQDTHVPFFSSLPFIGRLFEGKAEKSIKTELVIMVTPRILESPNEWADIKSAFEKNLSSINIH